MIRRENTALVHCSTVHNSYKENIHSTFARYSCYPNVHTKFYQKTIFCKVLIVHLIKTVSDEYTVSLTEEQTESAVVTVQAVDLDMGNNGRVTYGLVEAHVSIQIYIK